MSLKLDILAKVLLLLVIEIMIVSSALTTNLFDNIVFDQFQIILIHVVSVVFSIGVTLIIRLCHPAFKHKKIPDMEEIEVSESDGTIIIAIIIILLAVSWFIKFTMILYAMYAVLFLWKELII